MSDTLHTATLWRVWLRFTEPVLIIAPNDATLNEVARAAKVAMHDRHQANVRPEYEGHDRAFWTDAVADQEVRKIERGEHVWLSPKVTIS